MGNTNIWYFLSLTFAKPSSGLDYDSKDVISNAILEEVVPTCFQAFFESLCTNNSVYKDSASEPDFHKIIVFPPHSFSNYVIFYYVISFCYVYTEQEYFTSSFFSKFLEEYEYLTG